MDEQFILGYIRSIKRKELCRIWAEYGAAVLKTFRTQYDPELKQKQARMKEEYDKMSAERTLRLVQERKLSLFRGADPRSIYYNNKLLSNEDRNGNCKYHLEKRLEPAFVEMLVRFYPGQAGEVVKYLKKAGYADQEIGDLIDRTVGRDGKTEFLYKGAAGGASTIEKSSPVASAYEITWWIGNFPEISLFCQGRQGA